MHNDHSSMNDLSEDSIIRYSGMFMHKRYLCFMWHDLFKGLRERVEAIYRGDLEDTMEMYSDSNVRSELLSLFISSVIPQLSGKKPALYPMVKPPQNWPDESDTSSKISRRLSEVFLIDENGSQEAVVEYPRRRRTKWDGDDVVPSNKEVLPARRSLLELTNFSQNKSHLTPEDIWSIVNYFGSHSRRSSCWCSGTDFDKILDKEFSKYVQCSERCPAAGELTIYDLQKILIQTSCD